MLAPTGVFGSLCIRIQYSPDAPFWQGRPYAVRRLAFLTSFRISSTTSTISSTAAAPAGQAGAALR